MGLFSRRGRTAIANPAGGQLQVVACSPFPDAGGEMVLYPECEIDGVIAAERLAPTAVHYSSRRVPKLKWPRPGMVLPVTVDLADPHRFRIEWGRVPTGPEAAADLAASLRGELPETPAADFPRVWRETEGATASSALVNGLTPQQTELALSGNPAAVGLVPAVATVLSAREAGPSSAPGGTWDIAVLVAGVDGGPAWEAVTRMSFSSAQRREMRTAAGRDLPVLVDPDNRHRIVVDVARLPPAGD